jgi:hypothetical protein
LLLPDPILYPPDSFFQQSFEQYFLVSMILVKNSIPQHKHFLAIRSAMCCLFLGELCPARSVSFLLIFCLVSSDLGPLLLAQVLEQNFLVPHLDQALNSALHLGQLCVIVFILLFMIELMLQA